MGKNESYKRNKLDIILTDSRPVEVLKNFTIAFFYEYLNENKDLETLCRTIHEEIVPSKGIKGFNNKMLVNAGWHSMPLKYYIYKNSHELREMSILNPLSLIEMRMFIEAYEKELLFFANKAGFSVRKHYYNNSLRYIERNGKGLVYINDERTARNLEASGNFYKVSPYKFLSDFHNSSLWYELNREYRYCGKIDYNKCFDSVYTHTFTWLVADNLTDRKVYARESNYFLNACDTILQNMNGSVTNGIAVGPEFSRLMVEILMQHIDTLVKNKLANKGYIESEHYRICRFVDDIFVFADEEKNIEYIMNTYAREAGRFHFRLNEKKRYIGKLPTIWFEWKEAIRPVNEYIRQAIFRSGGETNYIVKNFIRNGKGMVPIMKMMFQDTVASFPEKAAKITSYVLSTIYKKIKSRGKRRIIDERYIESVLTQFIDIVFYFYSFAPTYNNTEKIVGILFELSNEAPDEIYKEALQKNVNTYKSVFSKSNLDDIVNLILIFHFYDVQLPYSSEMSIIKKIKKENNPILYALLLLYAQYDKSFRKDIINQIYMMIIHAIENIHYNPRFFEYKECWWFYIFCDCPYIKRSVNKRLKRKLKDILSEYVNNDHVNQSKRMIIEFLLDRRYRNKFFDWNFTKDDLYAVTEYKTYQRMILNGLKVQEGYIEDEDY